MKKIFIAIAAVAAMTFASCGGNTTQGGENDSIPADSVVLEEVGVADAEANAEAAISSLADKLKVSDVDGITKKIAEVQAYIQELINTGKLAAANVYVEKLQSFINENEEKLSALSADGTNSVKDLLGKVTALTSGAESLAGNVQEAADGAKAAVDDAVENAKAKAQEKVEEAKAKAEEKAAQAVEDAKAKAQEAGKKAIDDAANEAKKKLGLQ